MRFRVAISAATFGLLLTACNASQYGAGLTPRSPSSPRPGGAATVTEHDRVATLTVGQTLLVELHALTTDTNWSAVEASDSAVLRARPIYWLVPSGLTVAAFQAVKVGRAEVTSQARPICSPGLACPDHIVLYWLQVTVTS